MKKRSDTEKALAQLFSQAESQRMLLIPAERWQARALGLRASSGDVERVVPGVYARKEYWDGLKRREKLLHLVKAEATAHPTWVFSHSVAAVAHGLDVSNDLVWPIHFFTDDPGGGKAPAHHVHHRVGYSGFVEVDGIKVTDPKKTVVDCARTYSFGKALAIADSALHTGLVTKDDLEETIPWFEGTRGIRGARRVVEFSDSRPESGGESIVRALMIDLGLPLPELQAPVPGLDYSGQLYYVDFMFRPEGQSPVAFELDGLEKYRDASMTRGRTAVQVMAAERQREAAITASGVRVVRMGFSQATNPAFLLRRLSAYGIVPTK